MLEIALALAARGWRVHPLHWITPEGNCSCKAGKDCPPKNRGKHPKTEAAWQKKATTDTGQIRDWWRKWPLANIGIVCGRGLCVLDVDPASGGNESLAKLPDLPVTYTVDTPTGGRHYYFTAPPAWNPGQKNGTMRYQGQPLPGLDSRPNTGGYVVAAGSRRVEGTYTAWGDIAPLPDFLRDVLDPPKPKAEPKKAKPPPKSGPDPLERARKYVAKMPPGIQGQGGSNATFAAACAVGPGFALDYADAFAVLQDEFNPRCVPPWDEDGLRHKLTDAYKKCDGREGWLRDKERPRPAGIPDMPDEPPPPGDEHAPNFTVINGGGESPGRFVKIKYLTYSLDSAVNILLNQVHRRRALETDEEIWFNELALTPYIGEEQCDEKVFLRFRRNVEKYFRSTNDKDAAEKIVLFSHDTTRDAFVLVAHEKSRHPIRDYLNALPSSKGGIEQVARKALHLSNKLDLTIMRRWAIGCVARALKPGCKVDTVLIFVGAGGHKKSTFFIDLAGAAFSDTDMDMRQKDRFLQLHQNWIYEWSELSSISKSESDTVKSFISSRSDDFREPFGTVLKKHPRSVVIVGTTNDQEFLRDQTGGGERRFWPIHITQEIDLKAVDRDAFWAEAVAAFKAGEQWWFEADDQLRSDLLERHSTHRHHHLWEPEIERWLEQAAGPVHVRRILLECLGIKDKQDQPKHDRIVAAIMRQLGWQPAGRTMVDGERLSTWRLDREPGSEG